jgi:hypothetical protein
VWLASHLLLLRDPPTKRKQLVLIKANGSTISFPLPNFSKLAQEERPSNGKRQVETFTVTAVKDVFQFTNCIS